MNGNGTRNKKMINDSALTMAATKCVLGPEQVFTLFTAAAADWWKSNRFLSFL